jgi:hypothetical protein
MLSLASLSMSQFLRYVRYWLRAPHASRPIWREE